VKIEEIILSFVLATNVVSEARKGSRADHLEVWLSGLRRRYADRILPIDLEIAEEWGRMNAPDPIFSRDGLMAATAKVGNMTFVTRNTSDVARTGVLLLNPFGISF